MKMVMMIFILAFLIVASIQTPALAQVQTCPEIVNSLAKLNQQTIANLQATTQACQDVYSTTLDTATDPATFSIRYFGDHMRDAKATYAQMRKEVDARIQKESQLQTSRRCNPNCKQTNDPLFLSTLEPQSFDPTGSCDPPSNLPKLITVSFQATGKGSECQNALNQKMWDWVADFAQNNTLCPPGCTLDTGESMDNRFTASGCTMQFNVHPECGYKSANSFDLKTRGYIQPHWICEQK